jgi:phosphoribosylanthranilate isomerase
MTWVKICGMTNLEDALVAVDAGANAVGFVFYEKSPRYVPVETAREIVNKLPDRIETVGVFVGSSQAVETALAVGLDAMQSYLVADPNFKMPPPHPPEFRKLRNYLAMPYSSFLRSTLPAEVMSRLFGAVFIDSGDKHMPGGSGKTFDWREASPALNALAKQMDIVIAGGLTPENVGDAINILRPWGVDVASGVEARPGKKDPDKVRAFVKAVREADRKAS